MTASYSDLLLMCVTFSKSWLRHCLSIMQDKECNSRIGKHRSDSLIKRRVMLPIVGIPESPSARYESTGLSRPFIFQNGVLSWVLAQTLFRKTS